MLYVYIYVYMCTYFVWCISIDIFTYIYIYNLQPFRNEGYTSVSFHLTWAVFISIYKHKTDSRPHRQIHTQGTHASQSNYLYLYIYIYPHIVVLFFFGASALTLRLELIGATRTQIISGGLLPRTLRVSCRHACKLCMNMFKQRVNIMAGQLRGTRNGSSHHTSLSICLSISLYLSLFLKGLGLRA